MSCPLWGGGMDVGVEGGLSPRAATSVATLVVLAGFLTAFLAGPFSFGSAG